MAKETWIICRNIFKTSTKADTNKEFVKMSRRINWADIFYSGPIRLLNP